MQRIAVWNTAFLGDAVLTLPLLQTLRRAWPQARLDFYVRRGLAGLFEEHNALSAVYEYDKRQEGAGLRAALDYSRAYAETLRRRRYDLWVSAHRSLRSAWLARSSRAPVRVGYASPFFNRFFYTLVVPRAFPGPHETERLLGLAAGLGLKDLSLWPEIMLPEEARAKAGRFFSGLARPALGLHPGSVWATKRWPAEYFAGLARCALRQGAAILLFAGPGEEATAQAVLKLLPDKGVYDLSGRLSLAELAAFIAELDCYVGNDSGPMHLAWAQHVPVAAFFGPTTPTLGFAPLGEQAAVLEAGALACRPCGRHGPARCPKGHHDCMRRLTPELAWPKVEQLLRGKGRKQG